MPTYAELTAELLTDAAGLFKTMAAQNEPIRKDMSENAMIYERMAQTLMAEPTGRGPTGQSYSELAGKLLQDTAKFLRKLAAENPPVKEQMEHNAAVYDQIGIAVAHNPLGILD